MTESSLSMTPQPVGQSEALRRFNPDIRLEIVIGAAIGTVALFMRLWNLEWLPLNNVEASANLTALNISQGHNVSTLNPLATLVQALIFSLFGATDFSARMLSALSGTMLCLLPLVLRSRIGQTKAFLFCALLVLSPTIWFVSRQADGAVLAWFLGLLVLVTYVNGWTIATAISLGALLACGQDAVYPLIVFLAYYVLHLWRTHSTFSFGTLLSKHALVCVVAFVISASGLMLRPVGIGEALNGYINGFLRLATPGPLGPWRLLLGFAVYEPLIVFSAILGSAILVARKQWADLDVIWLLLISTGLILLAFDQSRSAVNLVPVLIGCAGLASHTATAMLRTFLNEEVRITKIDLAVFTIAACMLVYSYHGLIMYSAQRQLYWLFSVLVGILVVTATGIVTTITIHPLTALRGIGGALVVCLALYTFSNGYRLTNIAATIGAEAYVSEASSPGLRDLLNAVQSESLRLHGDPQALSLQVSSNAPPALMWALRSFPKITYTESPVSVTALISPASYHPRGDTPLLGSAFRTTTTASLSYLRCSPVGLAADQLDCAPLIKWLAFRAIDEQYTSRWIFWIHNDLSGIYENNSDTNLDLERKRE